MSWVTCCKMAYDLTKLGNLRKTSKQCTGPMIFCRSCLGFIKYTQMIGRERHTHSNGSVIYKYQLRKQKAKRIIIITKYVLLINALKFPRF